MKRKRKKNPSTYIPVSQCKENHLYVGWGRQSNLGIFYNDSEWPYFIGISSDGFFPFTEYHYDSNNSGTFKPLRDLGKIPNFAFKQELEKFLKKKEKSSEVKEILQSFQNELNKELEDKKRKLKSLEEKFGPYLYYCKYCEYTSEKVTAKCPKCGEFGTGRLLLLRLKDEKLYERMEDL